MRNLTKGILKSCEFMVDSCVICVYYHLKLTQQNINHVVIAPVVQSMLLIKTY